MRAIQIRSNALLALSTANDQSMHSDPVQARRIQQRGKMIMFGKNTAGYDVYIKQVPKESRRPRCVDHPATPDHTLDIPNRRWQGMVKAW